MSYISEDSAFLKKHFQISVELALKEETNPVVSFNVDLGWTNSRVKNTILCIIFFIISGIENVRSSYQQGEVKSRNLKLNMEVILKLRTNLTGLIFFASSVYETMTIWF